MGLFDFMKKKKEKKEENNSYYDENKSLEDNLNELANSETNQYFDQMAHEAALDLERDFKLKKFNEEFGKTYDKVKAWIAYDSMGIKSDELDELYDKVNNFFEEKSITIDKIDFLLPFIIEKANRNIASVEETQVLNSSRMRYGDDFAKVVFLIYKETITKLYGADILEKKADSIMLNLYAEAKYIKLYKNKNETSRKM